MIRLREFERIVFFTGAGLSAESGIPTYRGRGGVWHAYAWEEYACQRAFERDPDKVWDFHDRRRALVKTCEPNAAHRILAEVQRARPATVIVTQNVDGLHQRAGARDVIELHGSLWRVRCAACRTLRENHETPLGNRRCPCGGWLRPDVTWFEDPLDLGRLRAAADALAACDLLVTIGTSGVVYPAAELPRLAAAATRVEVNPEETPHSPWYTHHLREPASVALARLWE